MTIEEIEEQQYKLRMLKHFLKVNQIKDDDTVEVKIFKKYIELENVRDVTEYINNSGYRLKASKNNQGIENRKYKTNDITAILKNKKSTVPSELKNFIPKLKRMRKRGMCS